MSTETIPANPTKVVITGVRFSYAHVFEPHAVEEGQEPKYSVCLIIPKTDVAMIKKIKAAIEAAKQAGMAKTFGGKIIEAKFKMPLRDGDDEKDDENYDGCFFINANCKTKPGVVDRTAAPIMDQDDFYSGCYGAASVNFYPFNSNGSKGVACGLNHVMKLKDGDSLSGRSKAEDDFAELIDDSIL